MNKAVLPVYSKKASGNDEEAAQPVEEWREKIIFEENEIGKGTPSADLKRMYLCPWEVLSPRAFRPQQGTDVEKHIPTTTSSFRRHLIPALALFSLLLLLSNLLLFNIKLLPSSFPYPEHRHLPLPLRPHRPPRPPRIPLHTLPLRPHFPANLSHPRANACRPVLCSRPDLR